MAKKTKRADQRYERKFTYNGRRYSVYGKTLDELGEKEFAKRKELSERKEIHDNPTLNEYRERFESRRAGSVKPTTLYTEGIWYKKAAEILLPDLNKTLGEARLSKITVDDLHHVQKELSARYTTNSTNSIMAHLGTIFADAFKIRMIDYNPMGAIKSLKRTEPKARDTIHRALSDKEQAAFFEHATGSAYYNLFRFLINTGARIGEAGAMLPGDVDREAIHIKRTLTESSEGVKIGQDTKTRSGERDIPLNDTLRAIIRAEKEHNKELWDGGVIFADKPIFRSAEGSFLRCSTINREIETICEAAGVERFTLHAFRATFCTNAIDNGIALKVVQELMGHATISMTADLYGHAKEERKAEAMEIMQRKAI